jgi:hypothetical protein
VGATCCNNNLATLKIGGGVDSGVQFIHHDVIWQDLNPRHYLPGQRYQPELCEIYGLAIC